MGVAGLAALGMAQAPDAGCTLPSEPEGIPAALDAAITGPADRDRACMKALLIPEARMMFASLGTGGAPSYKLETLNDWIARVSGHALLEEKQLRFHIERYGNIAHLWSSYALRSDGKQVADWMRSARSRASPPSRSSTRVLNSCARPAELTSATSRRPLISMWPTIVEDQSLCN
jgi:hypothetical protein